MFNQIKTNNISNSAPKNSEKNKNYSCNKYPHNNYSKKNRSSIKIEEKINSQNNTNPNIHNLENNKIENNINLKIINNSNNKIKKSNNNLVKETQKQSKSEKNNLVVEIYNFFNDSKIKGKTNIGPKNNHLKNNNIMNHNNKDYTNLYDNRNKQNLLNEEDNKNERKESKHKLKKESYDLRKNNNYLNSINSSKSNNIINNKQNLINSNKKIENNNNLINNKNKLENTPFEGLKTNNFETITLNSNYSISTKEPKMLIYGDKNIKNKYENLKTYNNNTLKNVCANKKIKKMIYKKENTTEKKNNKINCKNRYIKFNSEKFDIGKKNKSITIINDFNNISINNINKGNKNNKNILRKKINSEYLIKSTDMLNGSKDKNKENKENNNYIGNNKSTNIINNYINNFNNFNFNYLPKNDKLSIDKDDYIFNNINNIIKPNKNKNIDNWSYNNKKIDSNYDNSLNNQYILSTSIKNKKNIAERNLKDNKRSIYLSNEMPVLPYNNIDFKMKLDKTKKFEVLYTNNGTNYNNHITPIITCTNTIEYGPKENHQNLNTSPIATNKNYFNIRKYEKFVKQYNKKKE